MSEKFNLITKIFNWCVKNGCPKFTSAYKDDNHSVEVQMNREGYEVNLTVDLNTYLCEMTIISYDDSIGFDDSLDACLEYLINYESEKENQEP